MVRKGFLTCAFVVCAAGANAVYGQSPTPGPRRIDIKAPPAPVAPAVVTRDEQGQATVRAIKLSAPLNVDGKLDEPVYRDERPIDGFIQVLPDSGKTATENSEVWVTFDKDNIYVSARLWQKEATIIANELRRDKSQGNNDTFGILLDTFYDRQTGYLFYTSPIGALGDCQISEGGSPNCDYNAIWDARVARFEGGWSLEMKIPFKTLRYRSGSSQVWGIQFRRTLKLRAETSHVNRVPVSVGSGGLGRPSYAATLVGIETPPASGKNLEIKPYAIGRVESDRTQVPAVSNHTTSDFGLDVKYGVTKNLTADFTLNTDFAQVEVDDQQVNLTRFNLVFPEKREFFLEGRSLFEFGSAGQGGNTPTMFFSRQIGI